MQRYLYLSLAGLVCLGSLVVAITRPDLRRPIMIAGLAGGLIEAVSELWYFHDYWHPPTLLAFPTPEDLLYGFGVTALAVCAVPFWFNGRYQRIGRSPSGQTRTIAIIAFTGFAAAIMTTAVWTGWLSSIWAACLCYAVLGIIGCSLVPELTIAGIWGGLIMGLLALVGYWIGLNHLIDGNAFLNRVLLHPHQPGDIRILGQVPFDEVVWNTARGFCFAVVYPLLAGVRIKFHSRTSRMGPVLAVW